MSGQQIGTVVGGVIGAYFGGPAGAQLGMAIGGAVGGAVDPTKINGPRIGDGQQQTATDGSPIAWVSGTASVAGTLVQVSERRQVKVKDSGKGGPVVSHYEARQDFAILVCESCELRDSTIDSILMVQQDGKLVYDVRPGSLILDQSAKWKANVDFLFGSESQLPHPTMEAITGVGNTPSYRGSCLAVFTDFNVTAAGDRVPSFLFTVSTNQTRALTLTSPWRYMAADTYPDALALAQPGGDDSLWVYGLGPFGDLRNNPSVGTFANSINPDFPKYIATTLPLDGITVLRQWIYVTNNTSGDYRIQGYVSPREMMELLVNGTNVKTYAGNVPLWADGIDMTIPSTRFNLGLNLVALICTDDIDHYPDDISYFLLGLGPVDSVDAAPTLAELVTAICVRGGLSESDIDVTDIAGITVHGYPVARQCTAVDCLTPLLQAFFCYSSEYDGQIHFLRYGADAAITIDGADLLEANDANDNNVASTKRNQSTEFPRKITASYVDPAQNYTPVVVSAQRIAVDVTAIGEQTLSIPVVMPADQAQQAVDKALKVAYATLEGTQEYSVPFARSATYLSICAGDPILFRGKRWVVDEAILSTGYIKLTTRFDRQSAYTSTVQAILGNPPTPPSSPYSGPTVLVPMNLPSLRPQDTYGVYLAANSVTPKSPSWRGCTVQVSYDGQTTWQTELTITQGATIGALLVDEPTGGDPLTVQMNDDLETVTDAQIAANANAFAFIHADSTEVGQFKTATEDGLIVDKYTLTSNLRGLGGTARAAGTAGDGIVMLDSVYFLPVDPIFQGRTLFFRAVGFGEKVEDATIVSLVYGALAPVPLVRLTTEDGQVFTTEDGINELLAE